MFPCTTKSLSVYMNNLCLNTNTGGKRGWHSGENTLLPPLWPGPGLGIIYGLSLHHNFVMLLRLFFSGWMCESGRSVLWKSTCSWVWICRKVQAIIWKGNFYFFVIYPQFTYSHNTSLYPWSPTQTIFANVDKTMHSSSITFFYCGKRN